MCHHVGVSKNNSKKTIVRFINRKHAKKALISRKNLRKSSSTNCNIFINENLMIKNNEIAFLSRKLNAEVILLKYIQETRYHLSLSMVSWLYTDFCIKANIFHKFFASICTPTDNTSCLPYFSYRTGSRIKSFHVTENDILVMIKTLDPNKAHGCDICQNDKDL